MNVLNLYSGIGGNRKLWTDVDVTAVEIDEDIARVYQDYFPEDVVVVADAHEYLLEHYDEYDFIWSSPPCPTHSRARFWAWSTGNAVYPDMNLYQEIILLKTHFQGKFVVENVIPYYEPLITGKEIGRHTFWSNFKLGNLEIKERFHKNENRGIIDEVGFDIDDLGGARKKVIRNMVHPEIGKYILDRAKGIYRKSNDKQMAIFNS